MKHREKKRGGHPSLFLLQNMICQAGAGSHKDGGMRGAAMDRKETLEDIFDSVVAGFEEAELQAPETQGAEQLPQEAGGAPGEQKASKAEWTHPGDQVPGNQLLDRAKTEAYAKLGMSYEAKKEKFTAYEREHALLCELAENAEAGGEFLGGVSKRLREADIQRRCSQLRSRYCCRARSPCSISSTSRRGSTAGGCAAGSTTTPLRLRNAAAALVKASQKQAAPTLTHSSNSPTITSTNAKHALDGKDTRFSSTAEVYSSAIPTSGWEADTHNVCAVAYRRGDYFTSDLGETPSQSADKAQKEGNACLQNFAGVSVNDCVLFSDGIAALFA